MIAPFPCGVNNQGKWRRYFDRAIAFANKRDYEHRTFTQVESQWIWVLDRAAMGLILTRACVYFVCMYVLRTRIGDLDMRK